MNLEVKGQSPEFGPLSQNARQGRCWQTQTQDMAGVRTSIQDGKSLSVENRSLEGQAEQGRIPGEI